MIWKPLHYAALACGLFVLSLDPALAQAPAPAPTAESITPPKTFNESLDDNLEYVGDPARYGEIAGRATSVNDYVQRVLRNAASVPGALDNIRTQADARQILNGVANLSDLGGPDIGIGPLTARLGNVNQFLERFGNGITVAQITARVTDAYQENGSAAEAINVAVRESLVEFGGELAAEQIGQAIGVALGSLGGPPGMLLGGLIGRYAGAILYEAAGKDFARDGYNYIADTVVDLWQEYMADDANPPAGAAPPPTGSAAPPTSEPTASSGAPQTSGGGTIKPIPPGDPSIGLPGVPKKK